MKIQLGKMLSLTALVYGLIACGGATVTAPTVAISSPSADAFTKGSVTIQVAVTGAPDSVDLLKDGTLLATLPAPYTYTWDTTTEPEKAYSLSARANKAGTTPVVSAAKQITVDRTAPSLVSRVPASGAVNVFLADEISTTFSEPMLASSVTASSAQLKIGTNVVASSAALDTAGTKLVLKPTLLPALTATINVVLNGLTDRAGNALVVPNSSFNAPDWQAPGGAQALNSASTISAPQIAIDSSGKPVVAWQEAGNINVKKWNGTTWDLLPTTSGGVDSMALDSAGHPMVSWNQYVCCSNEFKYDTYVKKWDGAAWVQLGTVLDVNTNVVNVSGYSTTSSIAIDSTDNPIVVWAEYDGSKSYNIYAKRWNGVNWVQLGTILDANTDQDALDPTISVSSGNTIIVWRERDGTSFNLYVKKWNGSAWVALGAALNATNNTYFDPISVALDSSGNPTASWAEGDGTSANIYAKKWNGSAWVAQGAILDVNPNDSAFSPSLALDSSNNPFVTWNENSNVYVKRFNRIP